MSPMNRRRFLEAAGLSAASLAGSPGPAQAIPVKPTKKPRTMYFNDARHFYLYCYEPPIRLEDAWRPIDEVAGTAVNTFIFGSESGGLFSDTKVGMRWGANQRPFTGAYQWRAWYAMQSLIDRGLDPLQVLVDRAHQKGLEFITSMRISGQTTDPKYHIGAPGVGVGGAGPRERCADFGYAKVRQERFRWLEELAGYPVEGIELDFAFTPYYFKPDRIKAHTPVMTDYVRQISSMVRSKGRNRVVGARVFPTEAMNLALGLDVRRWLSDKLVDYVAPIFYGYFALDADLPFEWMVEAAHSAGGSVYPILQPYYLKHEDSATPAMFRAAAANYWAKGADGLIAWFLHWPFGEEERSILTDLGDPDLVREKDKHYVVPPRVDEIAALGYNHPLPLKLEKADPKFVGEVPFYVADDVASEQVGAMRLQLRILNLVAADRLNIKLNGASLAGERVRRTSHRYEFQWLEYTLARVRPRKGRNTLTIALEARPEGLEGGITLDRLEVLVEYDRPRSAESRPAPL